MLNATMICRIGVPLYVRDDNRTSISNTCLRNVSARTHLAFQTRPVCGNTCFGMTVELQCHPNSALLHIEGRVLQGTKKGGPAGVHLFWPQRVENQKNVNNVSKKLRPLATNKQTKNDERTAMFRKVCHRSRRSNTQLIKTKNGDVSKVFTDHGRTRKMLSESN